ncbi:MAG: YebG family protein [Chromatiales bacterium]|jgi:uncharacterized protein|nr:YebG family protein [Chromatiales bacterium]
MAVVAMWQCDRDGSMFASKKDAEDYDKMLELAESFTAFIEANSNSTSGEDAEAIGLLLAKHKDAVMAACKGKPDQLVSVASGDAESSDNSDSVVTPITSKA